MKTDPVYQRLVTLVEQWRKEGDYYESRKLEHMRNNYEIGEAMSLSSMLRMRECARELSAALALGAAPPPDEPPSCCGQPMTTFYRCALCATRSVVEAALLAPGEPEAHPREDDDFNDNICPTCGNETPCGEARTAPEPEALRRPEPGTDGDMRQEIEDLRCLLNTRPILSKFHGLRGFELEKFIEAYSKWTDAVIEFTR